MRFAKRFHAKPYFSFPQLPLSCWLATSSAAVAAEAQASGCTRSRFAHHRLRWSCHWLQNAPANGGRGISAGGFLLAHLNDPTAAPAAISSARARVWGPLGSWVAWVGYPGIRGECRRRQGPFEAITASSHSCDVWNPPTQHVREAGLGGMRPPLSPRPPSTLDPSPSQMRSKRQRPNQSASN